MSAVACPILFRVANRSFAPALRLAVASTSSAERACEDPDRAFARRAEAGLDRLLRDIERFEEVERWDGMS